MFQIYGVTGSFGCGKSEIATMISRLKHAKYLNADDIAKTLYKNSQVKIELSRIFGQDIFDRFNRIDTKNLARIVFNNKKLLKKLETIIHPRVKKNIIRTIKNTQGNIVLEAPLMIESGLHKLVDKLVVVTSSRQNIYRRLLKKGFNKKEILKRLSNQMIQEKKCQFADIIIRNNKTLLHLKKQIEKNIRTGRI